MVHPLSGVVFGRKEEQNHNTAGKLMELELTVFGKVRQTHNERCGCGCGCFLSLECEDGRALWDGSESTGWGWGVVKMLGSRGSPERI